MFIDIKNPIVIDNTDVTDPDFPASFYMPFNMDGGMYPDKLREEARWWTQNLASCHLYRKLRSCTSLDSSNLDSESGDDEIAEDAARESVEWSFMYDLDGNPKIVPEYPEPPDDPLFIGWRVHMNYLHGWTDSESDYEDAQDSPCGPEMPLEICQ